MHNEEKYYKILLYDAQSDKQLKTNVLLVGTKNISMIYYKSMNFRKIIYKMWDFFKIDLWKVFHGSDILNKI